MGQMQVPEWALWGASTQRAVENFPVSGRGIPAEVVHAFGLLKAACAQTNKDLGKLSVGPGGCDYRSRLGSRCRRTRQALRGMRSKYEGKNEGPMVDNYSDITGKMTDCSWKPLTG